MAGQRRARSLKWMTRDQRQNLRHLMGWLAFAFFGLILSLQTGWFHAFEDKRIALGIIGTVVAAVWFMPQIALASIAWRYEGEIDFGPLGKHSGRGKKATLLLTFTVEAIVLPLAAVLGYRLLH